MAERCSPRQDAQSARDPSGCALIRWFANQDRLATIRGPAIRFAGACLDSMP
jgi:hypothetical protein